MFFRQAHGFIKILRQPRDVVVTVISRLRARWRTFRPTARVTITGGANLSGATGKKLESEALFATSLVTKIIEDSFPGRKVGVCARLKGNPQPASDLLEQHFKNSHPRGR